MTQKLKNAVKQLIKSSSLSRVFKHITSSSTPFALLTAFRDEYSLKQNLSRNKALAAEIKKDGFGYFFVEGHWLENEGEDNEVLVNEDSIFVIGKQNDNGALKGLVKKMRKKYDQDSVLYRDAGAKNAVLIYENKEENAGKPTAGKLGSIYTKLRRTRPGSGTFTFASVRDGEGFFKKLAGKHKNT